MIKLYIVDIAEGTIGRLQDMFSKSPELGITLIGYAHNFNSCFNDVQKTQEADVFLVSAYLPDQMGVDLTPVLKKRNKNAKVIMMLQNNTRNLAEPSREKGADTIIQVPFKARELIKTIQEVAGVQNNLEEDTFDSSQDGNDGFSQPSYEQSYSPTPINQTSLYSNFSESALVSPFHSSTDYEEYDKPKVVCTFYSTGSSGKTTMLINVAAAIQKYSEYDPKICILDFNLLYPSVLYKFHQDDLLMGNRNIYDLCEDLNHLDETLINRSLITHEPTGIKILETPTDTIRDFSRISADRIEPLIGYLKNMFDIILIDTSSNIRDDSTSFPITISDKTIVLFEPDLSSLLHTRKFINTMKIFENTLSEKVTPKLNFVLNKENPKSGIHAEMARKALQNEVKIQIPEDSQITSLSNNGQFVVDNQSSSQAAIKELARLIYPFEKELSLSRNDKSKSNFSLKNLFNKRIKKK